MEHVHENEYEVVEAENVVILNFCCKKRKKNASCKKCFFLAENSVSNLLAKETL
jgi:hypothetical protein